MPKRRELRRIRRSRESPKVFILIEGGIIIGGGILVLVEVHVVFQMVLREEALSPVGLVVKLVTSRCFAP
jgi:hypothetical protein